MVVVPALAPVTMPDDGFTVATEIFPLAHVPPVVALLSVILLDWHTVPGPVIADTVTTDTAIVLIQPKDVV